MPPEARKNVGRYRDRQTVFALYRPSVMEIATILRAARERAGVDHPLDAHTLEGLETFVASVNREAGLSGAGEQGLSGLITAALTNRLRVEDYLLQHPELTERPVEKPMFVFGLPRTGTTLTINLLNEDPARRCLLHWEVLNSVPPPGAGELHTDPRCLETQARIDRTLQQSPESAAIHHEDADSPTECQLSMVQTMCSQVLEAIVHVPGYRRWFLDTRYLPAFRYHKRLLQLLQANTSGRWTLKNPWHPLFLEDLTAVYPDARLVMNHRDPVDMMGSACSLIHHVRSRYTDSPDKAMIAETLLDTFDTMIARTLDYRAKHGEDAIYDLHYDALMADPVGEMKKLYEHFDEPFTEQAEQAMRAFQANNPKGKHGRHTYSLEEYGLTKDQVREHFREYCEQFGIYTG